MLEVPSRLRVALAVAVVMGSAASAGATTLIRAGIDDLTANNQTVVIGQVLESTSYWNDEGTFILTDVEVEVVEVVAGQPSEQVMTVTVMGGTVGDLTTLVLGTAELRPGASYVLFLGRGDLPGAQGVRTVRNHAQGVFEVVDSAGELRAVSQARDLHLVPDGAGETAVPGGARGLLLPDLIGRVRASAARADAGKGVK